jgi:hypothetical protein
MDAQRRCRQSQARPQLVRLDASIDAQTSIEHRTTAAGLVTGYDSQ